MENINAEWNFHNKRNLTLVLDDQCIRGRETELVIQALQKHNGDIILNLPLKYEFDFRYHENVQFTPDQDVSLILQTLIMEDLA